jgi:hypothetical protein
LIQDAFGPGVLEELPQGKVDLFFYDGCHSEDAHEKAIAAFDKTFSSTLIYICDDWNWPHVKTSAMRGLLGSRFEIVFTHEIATREGDGAGYWNGLGLFVLKRKL